MERIHELLDELANAVKEKFPDCTRVSAVCDADGYRSLNVIKWGNGEIVETTSRQVLFDQSRIEGEWTEDRSSDQNRYYKDLGLLLQK